MCRCSVTSGQRVASVLSPISAFVRDDRLPFGARFDTFVERHPLVCGGAGDDDWGAAAGGGSGGDCGGGGGRREG